MTLSLGIFSWNMGDNVTPHQFDLIQFQITRLTKHQMPDLLVFCFQEVGKGSNLIEQMIWNMYNLQYSSISSDSACLSFTKFQIKTIVLANSLLRIKNVHYNSECISLTKGFVETIIRLPFMNLPEIRIYNTHFPFKSPKETKTFYANLSKRFQQSLGRVPVFVSGDINSRSLLTPECYAKNIRLDYENDKNNAYCRLKNYLELLPFDKTLLVSSRKRSRAIIEPKNCTDWQKTFPMRPSAKVVKDLLVQSDFINQSKNTGLFKDFQEGDINFFPTYKRDPSSGAFSLHKGSEGRLPGYADRILFHTNTNHPVEVKKYQSMAIKGNDHLPLFGLFHIGSTIKYKTKRKSRR